MQLCSMTRFPHLATLSFLSNNKILFVKTNTTFFEDCNKRSLSYLFNFSNWLDSWQLVIFQKIHRCQFNLCNSSQNRHQPELGHWTAMHIFSTMWWCWTTVLEIVNKVRSSRHLSYRNLIIWQDNSCLSSCHNLHTKYILPTTQTRE